MSKPDQLTIIEADTLVTATGGAARARSSSNDWMLQQTMQSITDSISSLKNQNNNSLSKAMPYIFMAKMMRDRGGW